MPFFSDLIYRGAQMEQDDLIYRGQPVEQLLLGGAAESLLPNQPTSTPMSMPNAGIPGAAATPPFVSSPQAKKKGFDGRTAALMALLPIALARGGRAAAAGLLSGFQQSQQQNQQTARQDRLDAEQRESRQAQERRLQEQAEATERERRLRIMQQIPQSLASFDDQAQLDAYLKMIEPQLPGFGIDPGAVRALVPPPTKLQERAANKAIDRLKAQHGAKWMEVASQFTHEVGGERIPFDELMRRAGMAPDPNAPQPAPQSGIALDVPLDRQHAAALASGNTALAKQIEESIRRQDSARRDPRDPVLGELARIRLEQQRAAGAQLPPNVQRRLDAKVKAFDSHPIAKRATVMAEAVGFAQSLSPNTQNPADDQALIYAFAKAMDPDSVVREGEYATIQKYAQSWAQTFGFNAARIFSNTAFLTPQARANMKQTIMSRFNATRSQYDNLRKSYANQINQITGGADGDSYLTDYGGAFPQDNNPRNDGSVPPNPYKR